MDFPIIFPEYSADLMRERRNLKPETMKAWQEFSREVFEPGALDAKTKQLIAVAVAHTTQCPYCIRSHTKDALKAGASRAEIMEAIWIAAAGRASSAYSHAGISRRQMEIDDGLLEEDGTLYPASDAEMAKKKADLAPKIIEKWRKLMNQVFKADLLSEKTKQLIALAIGSTTQCAYCIKGHTKMAKVKGATNEEMMEAIWVAAEMRAGGAYAHSVISIDEMNKVEGTGK